MDNQAEFLRRFDRQFTRAVSPPVDPRFVQTGDGKKVWAQAFGNEPTLDAIRNLDVDAIRHLSDCCVEYFECFEIGQRHMHEMVDAILN